MVIIFLPFIEQCFVVSITIIFLGSFYALDVPDDYF